MALKKTLKKLVSIPYRYATNSYAQEFTKIIAEVSIPYRYATNEYRYRKRKYIYRFQSLIGTLQTTLARFNIFCATLFQSLIGTLQTVRIFPSSNLTKSVSIPYRYATN